VAFNPKLDRLADAFDIPRAPPHERRGGELAR